MPGPYLNEGAFKTKVTDVVTSTDTVSREELGIWRFDAGRILRFMQAGSNIFPGEAVTLNTAVVAGTSVIQTSADTNLLFGVAEVSMPLNYYGWVTIYGPATARAGVNVAIASGLGPNVATGVLTIRNTSHFNGAAIAMAAGVSSGSAVYITQL